MTNILFYFSFPIPLLPCEEIYKEKGSTARLVGEFFALLRGFLLLLLGSSVGISGNSSPPMKHGIEKTLVKQSLEPVLRSRGPRRRRSSLSYTQGPSAVVPRAGFHLFFSLLGAPLVSALCLYTHPL